MVNPIYKFTLSANGGTEQQAFPIYKDDLAKEYELENNQEFYRAKLSGKLTFVGPDYDFIAEEYFDTRFDIRIYISYNAGTSWSEYWHGQFWKTSCTFDEDNKSVTLTPDVKDQYNDVLAGQEKEYDLIKLAPSIVPIGVDKRCMIQVYVPGQTVIGCFLSGMWWEQECEAVEETDKVTIEGHDYPALTHKYYFYNLKNLREIDISGSMSPTLPDVMTAVNVSNTLWSVSSGGYTFTYAEDTSDPDDNFTYYEIRRNSDNVRLWYKRRTNGYEYPPQNIVLEPVSGSGASGNVTAYVHDVKVYARRISDKEEGTYQLPSDDLVENNKNYTRVIPYNWPETIYFSTNLTQTPTQWGLYQPGTYYDVPQIPLIEPTFFPVSRKAWGRVSIWYCFSIIEQYKEPDWRTPYTLRDAFPLASVISVLLAQIAPGITHAETTAYSQFFYGTNPLMGINQRIFITPKSNIITLGYDQPAQKAPVTLKKILDMLRDCFRCYWFIDSSNRFRIEHVSYFMNGGVYPGYGVPGLSRDLTAEEVTRNGKKWSYCTSKFQYDKPEMAARYQFGWMDDVTEPFEGNPIDIVSKYVNPDKIEQVEVSQFSSDIDYILLNPGEISRDGFVLLAATLQSGSYKLPYLEVGRGDDIQVIQNGYAAFYYLQQYYFWDMPARYFKYNGVQEAAEGIKKLKTQTLEFPVYTDPDTLQLIRTNLGDGTIQKMSINLLSRKAKTTLKYVTEQ